MSKTAVTVAALGLLLTGCAQTRVPAVSPPLEPEPTAVGSAGLAGARLGSGGQQHNWVNITPLSQVSWDMADYPNGKFSDTYTRLVITSITADNCGSNPQCGNATALGYAPRNWIERLLVGTHHTINLTVKISIGDFSATVPLATVDHVSNRTDGEGFSRIVYHQAMRFPLFLVKGDGSNDVVSTQFMVKGSDQYQSSVAATALQVAQEVTSTVAPQAGVLTALSAQSNKDLASALDKTVSQLFGTSIDEEQWVDKPTTLWGDGVVASFSIPATEGDWDNESQYRTIGSWTVTFDYPRPSIFADAQICDGPPRSPADQPSRCFPSFDRAARFAERSATARPGEVLSFALVSGTKAVGTVGAYLAQQDWWANSLKTFPSGAAPKREDVVQFCRLIKDTIASLGLNYIDAGIVVVSVQKAGILPLKTAAAMQSDSECALAIAL
jgi:hypothetical protein